MYKEVPRRLQLSTQAWSLWAKTGSDEQRHLWESVPVHLADTAETARHIWREWLPAATKSYICENVGLSADDAESLVVWLAGVHDIGKATPSFQCKVQERVELVQEAGLKVSQRCENYPHSFMGQIIYQDWLERRGWSARVAGGLASVVCGHHGTTPSSDSELRDIRTHSAIAPLRVLGDKAWELVQNELLDLVFVEAEAIKIEPALKERSVSPYVQILLTGIVIMADWIASNSDLLPLLPKVTTWEACATRAHVGWQVLDLPKQITLHERMDDFEELLHRRFSGLPLDAALRPVQLEAVMEAKRMEQPGLLIIEAPMGCGKTEASLLCAEILAQRFGDGGVAYLLPTQATSNAMFARVKDWLELLLADQPMAERQDLRLLHGKAALNDDYTSLPRWGSTWMGDEEAGRKEGDAIAAHQWFGGRKRGLLAPFVVGTIDQLLIAALRIKHAQLRHLGLAGKVVIIDEVHAYDVYMNVYLNRVLLFLGAYHVPVILLSATLPPSRRAELMRAYAGQDKLESRRRVDVESPPRISSGDPAYPLITMGSFARRVAPTYNPCPQDGRTCRIRIDYLPDDDEALLRELRSVLVDGGCICVLRNTVARAQATYEMLSSELGVDVRLTHSRFIAVDRARNDTELMALLGPDSRNRPKKLVVVSTQVLEQSLDVDFDLLITDMAPVDLLLQRMGRLHRHKRGEGETERPPMLRKARCILTGVQDWLADPPVFARGIDAVYQPAILWRSIQAIHDRVDADGCLSLPTDIAPLVEGVYEGTVDIKDEWSSAVDSADAEMNRSTEARRTAAGQWLLRKPDRFNLNEWMRGRIQIEDEHRARAAVRDSEESIEVVVVTRTNRGLEIVPWVAEQYGVDANLGSGVDIPDDEAGRAAALCTVNLPPRLSIPNYSEKVISCLERSGFFEGWQSSRWLAGMLPLVVDEEGYATIGWEGHEFTLRYSRSIGLTIVNERRFER